MNFLLKISFLILVFQETIAVKFWEPCGFFTGVFEPISLIYSTSSTVQNGVNVTSFNRNIEFNPDFFSSNEESCSTGLLTSSIQDSSSQAIHRQTVDNVDVGLQAINVQSLSIAEINTDGFHHVSNHRSSLRSSPTSSSPATSTSSSLDFYLFFSVEDMILGYLDSLDSQTVASTAIPSPVVDLEGSSSATSPSIISSSSLQRAEQILHTSTPSISYASTSVGLPGRNSICLHSVSEIRDLLKKIKKLIRDLRNNINAFIRNVRNEGVSFIPFSVSARFLLRRRHVRNLRDSLGTHIDHIATLGLEMVLNSPHWENFVINLYELNRKAEDLMDLYTAMIAGRLQFNYSSWSNEARSILDDMFKFEILANLLLDRVEENLNDPTLND